MLKTLKLKLHPIPDQQGMFLATMERFNTACNWMAAPALGSRTTNKIALQKLIYFATRQQFGLSAQLTIRAIAKVATAYRRDPTKQPHFRPQGGRRLHIPGDLGGSASANGRSAQHIAHLPGLRPRCPSQPPLLPPDQPGDARPDVQGRDVYLLPQLPDTAQALSRHRIANG